MVITIDILSLILGMFIDIFIFMGGTMCVYFDDRWHTGFGSGWEEGCKYGREKAEKENKNNETN